MDSKIHHVELGQHFRDAIVNLLSTKLRTFLAILGILVGAASVVAMVSGGELMTRQVLLQFKSLGTNLLAISVNQSNSDESSNSQKSITLPQALAIKNLSPNIESVAPYVADYNNLTYAGNNLNGSIIGATPVLKSMMKLSLSKGRFISFMDHYSPYCVIGDNVYKQMLKANNKNPMGQQINVQGNYYTVAGVIKPWPSSGFIFVDLNGAVIIPIDAALVTSKYAAINNIILRLNGNPDLDQLQAHIKHYFQTLSSSYQLYFESPKQMIEKMKNQQEILTLFLGFIGAISLIVGGIGVMNIMLVSVTERKREIGIRMALGAKRRDIRLMFLVESTLLSLFGGTLGVILGVLISYIIALVKGWDFSLFILPPAIGFSISVFIGIFFGYYPAYKASKLDPIDCLRYE